MRRLTITKHTTARHGQTATKWIFVPKGLDELHIFKYHATEISWTALKILKCTCSQNQKFAIVAAATLGKTQPFWRSLFIAGWECSKECWRQNCAWHKRHDFSSGYQRRGSKDVEGYQWSLGCTHRCTIPRKLVHELKMQHKRPPTPPTSWL